MTPTVTSEPCPRPANRLFKLGVLALVVSLASCGGSGGGDTTTVAPTPTPIPTPTPAEFEVISGGDACGGAGCGGDSAGGGGVGSGDGGDGAGGGLGEMRNVKVTARKPDGEVLGSATLRDNLVSLYDRVYKGAFILEFADDGSGNGEYFDEAKRAWIKLQGAKLHVLVPGLSHHVSANPLTEAAYQWAIDKYGSESALTLARMTEANDTVLAAFNARLPEEYRISDVTNYAVAVAEDTPAGALPNTHAGRLGVVLAGMAVAANTFDGTLSAPALAFTRQLTADIVDDAAVNNSAAVTLRAYDTDLPAVLEQSVVAARSSFGSPALPAPSTVPSACFNPALLTVGTNWTLNYDETDVNGFVTDFAYDYRIARETTFNGFAALEEVSNYTVSGGTTFQTKSYVSPLSSQGQNYYGETYSVTVDVGQGPIFVTGTVTTSPPELRKLYVLKVGESYRSQYSEEVTQNMVDANGVVQPLNPSTDTYSFDETTVFVGFEDVTVPAGTFRNACKYVETDNLASTTTTFWITSSGQGILVKSVFDDPGNGRTSELRSGTVNGQAVR